MDDTRHGTLSLFAALDLAAILTCIYTITGRQPVGDGLEGLPGVIRDRKRRLSD
jgi:hypothetical protein